MNNPTHPTREQWLNAVLAILAPAYALAGHPLPANTRVAIGFPSVGGRGHVIGECWDKRASGDGHFEILLRPDFDEPVGVAATLAHEATHAAVGLAAGHRGPFKRVARGLGLAGPLTATVAGKVFAEFMHREVLPVVGPLPHGALNYGYESTAPKKQAARLILCDCEKCEYKARVARATIARLGTPVCPGCSESMVAHFPQEQGE